MDTEEVPAQQVDSTRLESLPTQSPCPLKNHKAALTGGKAKSFASPEGNLSKEMHPWGSDAVCGYAIWCRHIHCQAFSAQRVQGSREPGNLGL
jgi:hypothetical protein